MCIAFTSCRKYTKTGENSYIIETFNSQTIRGIENIDECHSSIISPEAMFPKGFLETYDYIICDFYFYSKLALIFNTDEDVEKAFMYLTYDDQTYFEAKEYLLNSDYYDFDSKTYLLNDYVFYEDLYKLNSFRKDGFFEKYDIPESEYRYPRWYNMVGFSDKDNTIVFLNASKFRAIDNFEEHVKAYYGEWYDFS